MIETRARLLDAAEFLFIERGFAGSSLRAITAEAQVNLAAINYYFRSKEILFREMLLRRLQPINGRRRRLLDDVEAAAAGAAAPVEQIIEAFVDPLFSSAQAGGGAGQLSRRLIGRAHADPSPYVQRVLAAECGSVSARFEAALGRALPEASTADIAIRLRFMIGVLVQGTKAMEEAAFSATSETEVIRQAVVMFVSGGLQTPPMTRRVSPAQLSSPVG